MDELKNETTHCSDEKDKTETSRHTGSDCPYHHDCANCPLNTEKGSDNKPGYNT